MNFPAENDNAIGFRTTPWHCHDSLILTTSGASYFDLSPIEILDAWLNGDVLICTRRIDNHVTDRWLLHREEPLDISYIQPGESLNIERGPAR